MDQDQKIRADLEGLMAQVPRPAQEAVEAAIPVEAILDSASGDAATPEGGPTPEAPGDRDAQEAQREPSANPVYYKSQREVDAAFGKRLAAERERWERAHQEELGVARALAGTYGGLEGAKAALSRNIETEALARGLDPAQVREKVEQGQPLPDALESVRTRNMARELLSQEARIREADPEFDVLSEMKTNRTFQNMILAGEPLERVYAYFHMDERLKTAEKDAESRIISRIQSRNLRPAPAPGAGSASARIDVSRLSEAEMRRIDERLKRGEKVYIG